MMCGNFFVHIITFVTIIYIFNKYYLSFVSIHTREMLTTNLLNEAKFIFKGNSILYLTLPF